MDEQSLKKRYYDFIRARPQGVIATVSADGRPEAALVDIAVTPALEIIFETTDQTRKFANLQSHPAIALVVGWGGKQTLQYDGIVEQLSGDAREEAIALYLSVFPDKATHVDWPGNYYFRTRPVWVRLSNYYSPRKIEEYCFMPAAGASLHRGSWWHSLLRGD
jgi:pyridoxine/pyridoxamine 5'-phosphate oxidase